MGTMITGVEVESIERQQETGAVRTQFDLDELPVSIAVIATLGEVLNTDPVELDLLPSTVDPDALDALFHLGTTSDGDIHVRFTHEEHEISVASYGVINAIPVDEYPLEGSEVLD